MASTGRTHHLIDRHQVRALNAYSFNQAGGGYFNTTNHVLGVPQIPADEKMQTIQPLASFLSSQLVYALDALLWWTGKEYFQCFRA